MSIHIDLTNKSAVVTGGTRGIGLAIANQLRLAGANVIITGTNPDALIPNDFQFIAVDFLSEMATQECIHFLTETQPDILINNAGINTIDNFEHITVSDFDRIHQVNVRVPFLFCQAVIPGMKNKKWGRIVNVSSIFGKISKAGRASYSASKFALDGMTAALAAEVAVFGVLANCVAPGFIDTELTRRILGSEQMQQLAAQIPLGRLGQVDEIAKLVLWLASTENTYVSGQNIVIDGGFTRV